jgi:hypothetical protein
MSNKSIASLATVKCPACDKETENGEVLLQTRFVRSPTGSIIGRLDRKTCVGLGLCPDHKREGYVTLIEAEPGGSYTGTNPDSFIRYGGLGYIRTEVWPKLFNVPVPKHLWTLVDREVFNRITKLPGAESIDPPQQGVA